MSESTSFAASRFEPLTNNNYALWSMGMAALKNAKHVYEDVIVRDEPVKIEGDEASERTWND